MTIRRILLGDFVTNCYLLLFSDRAVVIDPGDMPEKIEKHCEGRPITDVLLTHGHLDHIAALGDLCDRYVPRVYLHGADEYYLNDDIFRAPISGGTPYPRTDLYCTHRLQEGDRITLGQGEEEITLTVLHTPGHTPGSVCFHLEKDHILFSGDTLFKNARGRTDFPGSEPLRMQESLLRLSTLPGNTKVFPGHGFSTTVADESWIGGILD